MSGETKKQTTTVSKPGLPSKPSSIATSKTCSISSPSTARRVTTPLKSKQTISTSSVKSKKPTVPPKVAKPLTPSTQSNAKKSKGNDPVKNGSSTSVDITLTSKRKSLTPIVFKTQPKHHGVMSGLKRGGTTPTTPEVETKVKLAGSSTKTLDKENNSSVFGDTLAESNDPVEMPSPSSCSHDQRRRSSTDSTSSRHGKRFGFLRKFSSGQKQCIEEGNNNANNQDGQCSRRQSLLECVSEKEVTLIQERDRAIEEWTTATTKWEQLLDDFEVLVQELNEVKHEKQTLIEELRDVNSIFEADLDERDTELCALQDACVELEEKLGVAKQERQEALSQRDNTLSKEYEIKTILQSKEEQLENSTLQLNEANQKITSLQQQVAVSKHDRDHALKLWNSSVDERKKLHYELALLTQGRDAAIRKSFEQAEELVALQEERDMLTRKIKQMERKHSGGEKAILSSTTSKKVESMKESTKPLSDSNYEETTVSLRKVDTKFGLKVDTTVDIPTIMVIDVSYTVAKNSNIKRFDRILKINDKDVTKATKEDVENMIKDCPGDLLLTLRRYLNSNNSNDDGITNVEATIKSTAISECPLTCTVEVEAVNAKAIGVQDDAIREGDVIEKINFQDVSLIFMSLIKKLSTKSGGKVNLQIGKRKKTHSISLAMSPAVLRSLKVRGLESTGNNTKMENMSICSLASQQSDNTTISCDDNLLSADAARQRLVTCLEEDSEPEVDRGRKQETRRKVPSPRIPKREPYRGRANSDSQAKKDDGRQSSEHGFYSKLRRTGSEVNPKRHRRISNISRVSCGSEPYDNHSLKSGAESSMTLARYGRMDSSAMELNNQLATRVLRLQKMASSELGFTICGGNLVGIFIQLITDGSMASLGGLRVGDQILNFNSFDLTNATLDYASRVLLWNRSSECVRIEVQFEPDFHEIMKRAPFDRLFVKTLHSYEASDASEMPFEIGEIICVSDTMVNPEEDGTKWKWFGTKVIKNQLSKKSGCIPSIESNMKEPSGDQITNQKMSSKANLSSQKSNEESARRGSKTLTRSASDVKKWIRKRSSSLRRRKMKNEESKEDISNRLPQYQVLEGFNLSSTLTNT